MVTDNSVPGLVVEGRITTLFSLTKLARPYPEKGGVRSQTFYHTVYPVELREKSRHNPAEETETHVFGTFAFFRAPIWAEAQPDITELNGEQS